MATKHAKPITLPMSDPVILETLESNQGAILQSEITSSDRKTPIAVRVSLLSPEAKITKEDHEVTEDTNDDCHSVSPAQSPEQTPAPHDSNESTPEHLDVEDDGKCPQAGVKTTHRCTSQLARLPTPGPEAEDRRLNKLSARKNYPPQMVRLATVSVRSR